MNLSTRDAIRAIDSETTSRIRARQAMRSCVTERAFRVK